MIPRLSAPILLMKFLFPDPLKFKFFLFLFLATFSLLTLFNGAAFLGLRLADARFIGAG